MTYITVVPSYGRDYKNGKEVQTAWDEGKDFTIVDFGPEDGRQINKQDAKPGMTINVRFKKLTMIKVIKVKGSL